MVYNPESMGSFDYIEQSDYTPVLIEENNRTNSGFDRAYQQERLNDEATVRDVTNRWSSIAALSGTAKDLIVERAEHVSKMQTAEGYAWWYKGGGLTKEQEEDFNNEEEKETEKQKIGLEAGNDPEINPDKDPFVTDFFNKQSSNFKKGAMEARAADIANGYNPLGNPQLIGAADEAEYEAIQNKIRLELLGNFAGSDKRDAYPVEILNKVVFPVLRQREQQAKQAWLTSRNKELEEGRTDSTLTRFDTDVTAAGGFTKKNEKHEYTANYWQNTIDLLTPDYGIVGARNKVTTHLVENFKAGVYGENGDQMLQNVYNIPVKDKDSGKVYKFGERYKKDYNKMLVANAAWKDGQNTIEDNETQEDLEEMRDDLLAKAATDGYTQQEIIEIKNKIATDPRFLGMKTPFLDYIYTNATVEGLQINAQRAELMGMATNGTLTVAEVRDRHPSLHKEFISLAQAIEEAKPGVATYLAAISDKVKVDAQVNALNPGNATIKAKIDQLQNKYRAKVAYYLREGPNKLPPGQAAKQAYADLQKEEVDDQGYYKGRSHNKSTGQMEYAGVLPNVHAEGFKSPNDLNKEFQKIIQDLGPEAFKEAKVDDQGNVTGSLFFTKKELNTIGGLYQRTGGRGSAWVHNELVERAQYLGQEHGLTALDVLNLAALAVDPEGLNPENLDKTEAPVWLSPTNDEIHRLDPANRSKLLTYNNPLANISIFGQTDNAFNSFLVEDGSGEEILDESILYGADAPKVAAMYELLINNPDVWNFNNSYGALDIDNHIDFWRTSYKYGDKTALKFLSNKYLNEMIKQLEPSTKK